MVMQNFFVSENNDSSWKKDPGIGIPTNKRTFKASFVAAIINSKVTERENLYQGLMLVWNWSGY